MLLVAFLGTIAAVASSYFSALASAGFWIPNAGENISVNSTAVTEGYQSF